ncbi:MAG: hypothetical protein IPJ88_08845 [Myxococcales bacterium]|nr:MAG: hypothetical protein IPJ88_08845 [Myxococcales bacterium]
MRFKGFLLSVFAISAFSACGRIGYDPFVGDTQADNAGTCFDGVHNQDETDIDCGGDTCGACGEGLRCTAGEDCSTGLCVQQQCVAASCVDALLSSGETDIDCGGDACPSCIDGADCLVSSDCLSGVCNGNICQAPTCSDGIQNQDETDVDCGGSTCSACLACNISAMTDSGDFLVNTGHTIGNQGHPSTFLLANGNYVLLYSGLGGDRSIHGRIVNASGTEEVSDWIISPGPFDMMPYGVDLGGDRFLVVWDRDGNSDPIFARVYNYDGTAASAIFQVSAANGYFDNLSYAGSYGTLRAGIHPVDVLSGNRVVFTYAVTGHIAMVRMFDTSSNPPTALHAELAVSAGGLNISATSVLTLSNGNFMAIWNDGWQPTVYTRVYSPATNPPTALNSAIDSIPADLSSHYDSALMPVLLGDGTPMLSFTGYDYNTDNADGDLRGVYALRFSNDGLVIRDMLRLNTTTAGEQIDAVLCPLGDGGMVAAWSSENKDGSGSAFVGQIFNQDLSKVGSEFVINDTTSGHQLAGHVACAADGFLATWNDLNGADGNGDGVFAKAYTNACSDEIPECPATGTEFVVNNYTPIDDFGFTAARLSDGTVAEVHASGASWGELLYVTHYDALGNTIGGANVIQDAEEVASSQSIIPLNNGRFVVTWYGWDLQGNGSFGIRARLFNADFTPNGASFIVDPNANNQFFPAGTLLNGSDDWMVAYTRSWYEVLFQRYDASGTTIGTPVRVNSGAFSVEGGVGVERLSTGDLVVVWQQDDGSFSNFEIYGRVYDTSGTAVSAQFMVNTTTADQQKFTDANDNMANFDPVASLSNGNFVVVWSSNNQDGSNYGVYAQIFDPSTNPPSKLGGEILVNTETNNHQVYPSVAAFDGGGFVVSWQSYLQDGSDYGIYAQSFDNAGLKNGGELQINDTTLGIQGGTMLTTLANGTYMVGYTAQNLDGTGWGVGAKIMGICTP